MAFGGLTVAFGGFFLRADALFSVSSGELCREKYFWGENRGWEWRWRASGAVFCVVLIISITVEHGEVWGFWGENDKWLSFQLFKILKSM